MTDAPPLRNMARMDFMGGVIQDRFALSNKLANFVDATSTKGERFDCKKCFL